MQKTNRPHQTPLNNVVKAKTGFPFIITLCEFQDVVESKYLFFVYSCMEPYLIIKLMSIKKHTHITRKNYEKIWQVFIVLYLNYFFLWRSKS